MAINPRYARLENDFTRLKLMSGRDYRVRITHTSGFPPEEYTLELNCCGIIGLESGTMRPIFSNLHELRILLPPEYPRKGPKFQMLTSVWHPNIGFPGIRKAGGNVCIGDTGDHGYAPSMGLDDLVNRIIQMIRYENYGLERPLNITARDWARQHQSLFPLERS